MKESERDERDWCFPVGEYVNEELEARGWSKQYAAELLGGDVQVNHVWLKFLCCEELWFTHEFLFSQDEAERLARLFGTSSEVWMNLHNSFKSKLSELRAKRAALAATEEGKE